MRGLRPRGLPKPAPGRRRRLCRVRHLGRSVRFPFQLGPGEGRKEDGLDRARPSGGCGVAATSVGGLVGRPSGPVGGGQPFRGTRPHSPERPPDALRAGKAAHRRSPGSAVWGLSRPAGPRQLRLRLRGSLCFRGKDASPSRGGGLRGQRVSVWTGSAWRAGTGARLVPGEGPRWRLQLSEQVELVGNAPLHRVAPPFLVLGLYVPVTQTGDSSRALSPHLGAPARVLFLSFRAGRAPVVHFALRKPVARRSPCATRRGLLCRSPPARAVPEFADSV